MKCLDEELKEDIEELLTKWRGIYTKSQRRFNGYADE